MAASVKQLFITLCLIGLMAGSLCAGSIDEQTLNRQEQEKLLVASTRRLLLQELNRIYNPAPPNPPAPKHNYAPPYPPSRPAPKEYYAPPALPAPMEYYAPPGPPTTKQIKMLTRA